MIAKCFEILDRGTFIPVMAVKHYPLNENEADCYLLRRAGFAPHNRAVFVTKLNDAKTKLDPHEWDSQSRTMQVAHEYIENNFDYLKPGAVVDVEYILAETKQPKTSERFR